MTAASRSTIENKVASSMPNPKSPFINDAIIIARGITDEAFSISSAAAKVQSIVYSVPVYWASRLTHVRRAVDASQDKHCSIDANKKGEAV